MPTWTKNFNQETRIKNYNDNHIQLKGLKFDQVKIKKQLREIENESNQELFKLKMFTRDFRSTVITMAPRKLQYLTR